MVDCSYCGKQIKENAIRCIHCGKYLDGKSPHGGANIDTRHILDASGEMYHRERGILNYFFNHLNEQQKVAISYEGRSTWLF